MANPAQELNILGVVCPMTWVRTKMELDKLQPGERLQVRLDRGAPMANLPRSVKEEGHLIIKYWPEDDHLVVIIEKGSRGTP